MSDYVKMGAAKPGTNKMEIPGLDDPSISQEEKDLRLALALQQQENAAAYDAHKKRHDAKVTSQNTRTARSSVGSRLPAIRKQQKEGGNYEKGTSGTYGGPNESSDAALANELQKVEETTATTAKIIAQDSQAALAEKRRNGRSVF
jgi:hypothetical protein